MENKPELIGKVESENIFLTNVNPARKPSPNWACSLGRKTGNKKHCNRKKKIFKQSVHNVN